MMESAGRSAAGRKREHMKKKLVFLALSVFVFSASFAYMFVQNAQATDCCKFECPPGCTPHWTLGHLNGLSCVQGGLHHCDGQCECT